MRTIRVHRVSRALWWILLGVVLMGIAHLYLAPAAQADSNEIEQLEETIKREGLSWTPREYDRTFQLGAILRPDSPNDRGATDTRGRADDKLPSTASLQLLPASLDWRNNGGNWVSPVKDQGYCGSCWAFAAVGAMESLYAMASGTPGSFMDLSEQIAVSCSTGNYGCEGGYMDTTAQFFYSEGTYYESCFPYQAADLPCSQACANWRDSAFKIDGYTYVSQNVNALKAALQDAPFQVAMDVYSDFDNYQDGVYERTPGATLEGGHAVLLVGYQDSPGQYGGGYFIVKNSWDTNWGESGYFRIGYSQVTDMVDFGTESYIYTVAGSSEPTPTPTDGPSPTPTNTPLPTPTHTPVPQADAYEPDDTQGQASYLEADTPQTHSLMPEGDCDWLVFALVTEADIIIETSGSDPRGDTVLCVYNAQGALLACNDDIAYWEDNFYSRVSLTLAPGTYFAEVCGYWFDTTIDTYHVSLESSAGATWSIALEEGWNLISIPVQPSSTAPGDVLASISGSYDSVMSYVAAQDVWIEYDPSAPGEATLTTIDAQTPLWVHMTTADTLSVAGQDPGTTSQALVAGWNMVAYPSHETRSLSTATSSISAALESAWGYAGASAAEPWLHYEGGLPPWANTLDTFEPGHAYWVRVSESCSLTID